GGDYIAYAPNGCHTGSGEAQRFIRLVSKDEKGVEHNLPDNARRALFLPTGALPALLAH
ncbi:MAG: hypothetical protein IT537_19350, partial [Hyphomicrobiales bacterium]|nr:hypothetical protein [Hyphomicrobiales bacterium]